jgi:hypothetical protein
MAAYEAETISNCTAQIEDETSDLFDCIKTLGEYENSSAEEEEEEEGEEGEEEEEEDDEECEEGEEGEEEEEADDGEKEYFVYPATDIDHYPLLDG